MWRQRANQFIRYINKVFGFNQFLVEYEDSRYRPQIPAYVTILTLLLGLWQRAGSLFQLEQMGRFGELASLLGSSRWASADTLANALKCANTDALWAFNHGLVRKARRNKAFDQGTLAGWMVASLDGTELYRTSRPTEDVRREWSHRTHKRDKTEYYERIVAASYVGCQPRLQLGAMRIRPGEHERTASLRLVDALDRYHGPGWADILCLDAGFVSAPFINALRVRHKHVIVKIKQENMMLVREVKAEFAGKEPSVRIKNGTCTTVDEHGAESALPAVRYDAEIWDAEGCVMWQGLKEPIRCLKVRETRWTRQDATWVADDPVEYHIATSVPRAVMKPETVWLIMHRRWDIENSVFNDLKQNWHLGHCYTHNVHGIEAMMALFAIARNLLLLFRYRAIRPKHELTLKTLTRHICRGLLDGLATGHLRLDSG